MAITTRSSISVKPAGNLLVERLETFNSNKVNFIRLLTVNSLLVSIKKSFTSHHLPWCLYHIFDCKSSKMYLDFRVCDLPRRHCGIQHVNGNWHLFGGRIVRKLHSAHHRQPERADRRSFRIGSGNQKKTDIPGVSHIQSVSGNGPHEAWNPLLVFSRIQ